MSSRTAMQIEAWNARVHQVTAVLQDAQPASMRQMLIDGLPHCFSGSKRDAYQERFAELISSAVDDIRQELETVSAARDAKSKEAIAELEQRREQRGSLADAEESARAVVEAKESLLKETEAAVTEAASQHSAAATRQAAAFKAQTKLEKSKGEVTSIIEGPLRMLVEGGWDDEDLRDASLFAVQEYLTKQGASAALLAAMPEALDRKPAQRKAFDEFTVQTVTAFLAEKAQALSSQIEEAAPGNVDLDAEVLGGWAVLDVSREKVAEAQFELAQVKRHLKAATLTVQQAEAQVSEQEGLISSNEAEQKLGEQKEAEVAKATEALGRLIVGEPEPAAEVEAKAEEAKIEEVAEALVEQEEKGEADAEMKAEEPATEGDVEMPAVVELPLTASESAATKVADAEMPGVDAASSLAAGA